MRTIRRGVFETNSSSVHSLSFMPEEEYKKWNEDTFLYGDKVYTYEEAIEYLKHNKYFLQYNKEEEFSTFTRDEWLDVLSENEFYTTENFGNDMETFERHYTTPKGEKIVAFGYFGYDG